jgi:predicted RNA-binding protein with PUA-like domain
VKHPASIRYYLAKTEPSVYSIDDLKRDKKTVWDGVKNPQAVRAIMDMQSVGNCWTRSGSITRTARSEKS